MAQGLLHHMHRRAAVQAVAGAGVAQPVRRGHTAVTRSQPCNRTPMFLPRVLFRTLAPMLVLGLLLGGCIMPARQDGAPTQPSAKPPVDEPAPEMPAEDLIAVVSQDANVRTGPSTDHAIAYWLAAGDEVLVVDRNEEGTWLQIEHQDRPGWIFAALTNIANEVAELPADAPPAEPTSEPVVEPTPEPEPTPEAVEPTPAPTPEPTPESETPPAPEPEPSLPAVTVTGTVVNLRQGPGTDHPTAGQVRAGDQVHVTGRNADGSWLQVADPHTAEGRLWIYGPLTDIDGATVATLKVAAQVEVTVEVETPPTPEPAAPEPESVAQPTPEPAPQVVRTPQPPADCTRLHTVNPNETRLQQIVDWFGLDLAATAELNGLAPDTPLTAGWQICLPDPAAPPPQAPQAPTAQPQPQPQPSIAGQPCMSPWGHPHPCPAIPNHPERAVKSVPGVPVLHHPPGSYDRSEHPGLDYDFELVLGDDSTMWNWRMRDFEGCYDALRVHMGEIPESIGLKRLEVRLSDPLHDVETDGYLETQAGMKFEASHAYPDVDWTPVLQGTGSMADLHPDLADVWLRCYDRPRGRPDNDVFCRLYPNWGNSGSIHLEAAVNLSLADVAGQMSRRAKTYQYALNHPDRLHYNAYVVPLIDDGSGDPAGPGPCLEVTRAG